MYAMKCTLYPMFRVRNKDYYYYYSCQVTEHQSCQDPETPSMLHIFQLKKC